MGKTTPRVELDPFSLLSVKEPFVRVVILTQICSLKCKYVTNLRILNYHFSSYSESVGLFSTRKNNIH
jgi:pyruvate-formate lyase-activating enzyme